MPKINVYLPDALATAVKETGVPVSAVCQAALSVAVERLGRARRTIAALRDPATPADVLGRMGEGNRGRMTPRLVAALQAATMGPDGLPREVVSSLDLLQGVLTHGDNLAVRLLLAQGVDVDALSEAIGGGGADEPGPPVADLGESFVARLTMPARLAMAAALEAVVELGHNYVGCEHLLVGLAAGEGGAGDLLAERGVQAPALRQAIGAAAAGVVHERADSAGRNTATLADLSRRLAAVERQLAERAGP